MNNNDANTAAYNAGVAFDHRSKILIIIVSGAIVCTGIASKFALSAQQQQQACSSQEAKTDYLKLSNQIGFFTAGQAIRNHNEEIERIRKNEMNQPPLPKGVRTLGELAESAGYNFEKDEQDLSRELRKIYFDQAKFGIYLKKLELERTKLCESAQSESELAQNMQIWMAILASIICAVGGFLFTLPSYPIRNANEEKNA